ncbi:MAG TPA: ATP-binding protein, partial [Roseivirga sp.]
REEDLWYKPSQFIGKRISDVVPSPLGELFESCCKRAFETGQLQTLEYQFGKSDNKEYFEGRVIKLDETKLLVISRNISSRKNLEKELRKAKDAAESAVEAKSNFLATMSHEIRTPMNGVVGMISLLAETELSEEQKEYVETIQASSDTLLRIINDILDYSRIESGKLAFEESLFYLKKAIDDSISLVRFEAKKKGIIINSTLDERVPNFIRTDRGRLRQIILNLLSNAVKFTEHGSIILSVETVEITEKYVVLLFKVKDTGIGIPKNKLEGLFKEFTQVDSTHSRKFGGTGLGLAIVKRLVKMLHGKVAVESEMGVGTIFSFTIRAKMASKVAQRSFEGEGQAKSDFVDEYIAEQYPMKLLLAEDNSINRKLTLLFLERMGYIPDVAVDGFEVIQAMKNSHYDAILLDIAMPKMDGYQVTRIIQDLPLDRKPAIIGVSANAFKADIEKGLSAGMQAYLVKPINFKELRAKLIECFNTIQEAKA